MTIEYDLEADAAYIRLTNRPVARVHEQSDVCILDLDERGKPVGIELLSVFGFAGASLRALASEGILPEETADAALRELRRELVPA